MDSVKQLGMDYSEEENYYDNQEHDYSDYYDYHEETVDSSKEIENKETVDICKEIEKEETGDISKEKDNPKP